MLNVFFNNIIIIFIDEKNEHIKMQKLQEAYKIQGYSYNDRFSCY